jgi:YggT family protein
VTVASVFCALLTAYIVVLFARAIMSWIPIRPGTPWATIYGLLLDITEPALAPLRKVIPPAGMFDLSFIVLLVGLYIVRAAIC